MEEEEYEKVFIHMLVAADVRYAAFTTATPPIPSSLVEDQDFDNDHHYPYQ